MPMCPKCGRQVPEGTMSCPNCGYDMTQAIVLSDEMGARANTRKIPKRFMTIIFIIFIASLLGFIWTIPIINGSRDSPAWLVVLSIGSAIGVFWTGVIVFSYATGIPIGEGSE